MDRMQSFRNTANDDSDENFSDDEANAATKPVVPAEKPKDAWDMFRSKPPEDESLALEDKNLYQIAIRVLKLITYLVVFSLVLTSAVVSKLSVVLMASQLKPGTKRPLCHDLSALRNKRVTIAGDEIIQWHWALFFCFIIPEVATFLRSIRIVWFKGPKHPNWYEFLIPLFFEVTHTVGLGLFVYYVLPGMNAIEALMLGNSFCILPGILKLLSRNPTRYTMGKAFALSLLDFLALAMQVGALVLWTLVYKDESRFGRSHHWWIFPLSVILISFGWWENFVSAESKIGFIRWLGKRRPRLEATRYHSYKYIAPLKILLFLGTMCLALFLNNEDVEEYFTHFYNATTQSHTLYSVQVGEVVSDVSGKVVQLPSELGGALLAQTATIENTRATAFRDALLIQCIIAYFCYATAKFACKICIQGFSFAFPLTLAAPVSLAIVLSMCGARDLDVCYAKSLFPGYLFWNCPTGDFKDEFVTGQYGWAWLVLLVSQTWIAFHVWYAKAPRLARSETLFCAPFYNALFLDHNLLLNRKRDPHPEVTDHVPEEDSSSAGSEILDTAQAKERPLDTHPRIITCATMWHEERGEMISFFKSIFRLDADQCTRRWVKEKFGYSQKYYDYETHIYFDDAFMMVKQDGKIEYTINDYVKQFCEVIEEAACLVHETDIKLAPPIRYPTPYGGRLEWTLPGQTKLYCHLKNKDKIRHRKRWSQCMYMYYLLGYRIAAQDMSIENKEILAQNTYLLALDGDIDFHPDAVHLLVDRMRINPKLGAACGRIHPIGKGPMVWYQKFEYAIGHWLQKATEHMIGCVLCSPGCFSLFRAAALMDINVMHKYTTEPTEARHYVQYDQGEDRWLCTLMLQQGWRVEYCAASDSFTHAPEGFNEFYNQRRRWIPSTMANIIDLIGDYKRTVKINPDISMPYILYQFILMLGSIVGPGTIFLMLVGAFNAAFKLDNWTCFYLNAIPLGIFIIACYFGKQKLQLQIAQALSVIYALVMVAVLVALVLQVTQDGLFAPSSLFLVAITLSFVVAAIVHPTEFWCLPCGIVYYITIPSMYLLLIFYSLFNLNDVTWGTRENPAAAAQAKLEAEQQAQQGGQAQQSAPAAPQAEQPGGFLSNWIPGLSPAKDNSTGSFEFSFAGLFKLMCCVHEKPQDELKEVKEVLVKIHTGMEDTFSRLKSMQESLKSSLDFDLHRGSVVGIPPVPASPTMRNSKDGAMPMRQVSVANEKKPDDGEGSEAGKKKQIARDDLVNPFWNDDSSLGHGKTEFIDSVEIVFWKKMINAYLKPMDKDKKKEEKVKEELRDLRNKIVGAFFMFNAVFVTAMFLLQLNKDKLFFNWPIGRTYNMTFAESANSFEVQTTSLQLEPLGLLFVGFYAIILVVQFFAMLLHRFGTFSHIMASTDVGIFKLADRGDDDDDNVHEDETVKIVGRYMKFKEEEEETPDGTLHDPNQRRKTMANLIKQSQKPQVLTLDGVIERNFQKKNPEDLRRLTRFAPNQQRHRNSLAPRARNDSDVSYRPMRNMDRGTVNAGYDEESASYGQEPGNQNPHLFNRFGRRAITTPGNI